jgi:hypothetical protein
VLGGEHQTKLVSLQAHRLVVDPDALLPKWILGVAWRKRDPDLKHLCQSVDLKAGADVSETWKRFVIRRG